MPFPRGVERGRAHGLGVGIASTRCAPASCRVLRDYCAGSPIRTANSSPWRDPAADVRERRWGRSERAADVSPPASLYVRSTAAGLSRPTPIRPDALNPSRRAITRDRDDDEFVVRINASRSKKIRKPSRLRSVEEKRPRARSVASFRAPSRELPTDALAAPFFRGVAFARARAARVRARLEAGPSPPGRGIRAGVAASFSHPRPLG